MIFTLTPISKAGISSVIFPRIPPVTSIVWVLSTFLRKRFNSFRLMCSINLASDKAQVFSELHRVLRPGGRLFIADLVAPQNHGLIMNANGAPTIWTQNTSSALTETELMDLAADAGFMNGHITERFDCFGGASTAAGLLGANFFANKRYEIYF